MTLLLLAGACTSRSNLPGLGPLDGSPPSPEEGGVSSTSGPEVAGITDAAADAELVTAPDVGVVAPDLGVVMVEAGMVIPADAAVDRAGQASLQLDRSEADFAAPVGCEGRPASFRVSNTGSAATGPMAVELGGDFRVTANDCSGRSLLPGFDCALTVGFFPKSMGYRSATLVVSADPGGRVEAKVSGTGLGVAPVHLDPATMDFGRSIVGETTGATIFRVSTFGGPVHLGKAQVSTGDFVVGGDRCSGQTLLAGDTCELGVTFRPAAVGARTAALNILAQGCGGLLSASLAGKGLPTDTSLVIDPELHDFGMLCVPGGHGQRLFQVTNLAKTARGPLATTVEGPFQIWTDGCAGMTLPSGGSCQISVVTAQMVSGSQVGKLAVTAPGATASADLVATARYISDPTLTPAFIDFGSVPVGQASPPREVEIRHPAGDPPTRYTLTITNVAASDYLITEQTCDTPVAPGSSCRALIVFKPTSTGQRWANFNVTSSGCSGAGSLQMMGTGT